ncbi:MAG: PP2C family protein-serine/threonine phosphatase [Terriglobia bacterium]
MAKFTFWLIVYGVILEIFQEGGYRLDLGFVTARGTLWSLFVIGAVVAAVYYIGRFIGLVRRRLLWRLTRRLIAIYLFIAFVPVILILSVVCMGGLILNGQFAAFLVNGRLHNHYDELTQLNRVVAHEATHIPTRSPQKLVDSLQDFYLNNLRKYTGSYPDLEITLRVGKQARAFRLTGEPLSHAATEPRWFSGEEWAGIIMSHQQLSLRALDQEETPAGHLTLILSLPVTPQLLNMIGEGVGPVGVTPLESINRRKKMRAREDHEELREGPSVDSDAVPLPSRRMWLDWPVHGFSALHPVEWHAPEFHRRSNPIVLSVRSRIFTLNAELLRILGKFADTLVLASLIVVGVFLVIEIVALVTGIQLTRSITSTVNRLQLATEAVKAGNFSHRVGLVAHDQVSALGVAFDTMTASLERLIAESHEKMRLESELKIAEEVQRQLFPRSAPKLPGTQMFGECRPARGVSGDYYDFLKLGRDRIGLALGDVSGKGIYAALLMAGIQSAMRAQFYDGHVPDGGSGSHFSTATVLGRLNHQLYENTPESKYATFFYAIYDAQTRILLYTNAGHPPPFLFRRNRLLRLEAGGTVLGLFPSIHYQQEQIELAPGDLLLAFTDGLVEAENSQGEEFGEERLADVIREMIDASPELLAEGIYRTIMDWAGSAELQDDMTLLYLKTVS